MNNVPTIQEINDAACEYYKNTKTTLEEYEIDAEALFIMKVQQRQEAEEHLMLIRPQPPVSSTGNDVHGFIGGLFSYGSFGGGGHKTVDHHAPKYLQALEKWQARWDKFQAEEWHDKDLFCMTAFGNVKLKAKDAK